MKEKKTRKEVIVHVRMTIDEHEKLMDRAEKSGLSISELIRVCCSKKNLCYRISPEEKLIFEEILKCKNVLTWLNNSYHSKNFEELKMENEILIHELNEIIKKFKGK